MVREDIPGRREETVDELNEALTRKKWREAGGSGVRLTFISRAGEISASRKQRGGTGCLARQLPWSSWRGWTGATEPQPAQPLRP